MDITRLRYFQTLAHTGNMTKAAQLLYITQPGLSKSIHQLEEELEIELFNRVGREIQLNEYGETLLNYVDRAFSELEEGERVVKDITGLENGRISVAATFPHIFPYLMGEYLKIFPDVHMKQVQSSSTEMKQLIENNQIDFGISTTSIMSEGIEWINLTDDEIFITVSENHKYAGRKRISLKELSDERFIGLVEGYGFRDITDGFCRQSGFEPYYSIEVEESTAILQLVQKNYGISFTPNLSLMIEQPGIVAIPIEFPNCKRTIGIAYKKDRYFSKASISFLEFIMDFFKDY